MARFAEEDRVEQMNAQKRRLCIEQHKRESARLIAEKQALVAAAKASSPWLACQGRNSSLVHSVHMKVFRFSTATLACSWRKLSQASEAPAYIESNQVDAYYA